MHCNLVPTCGSRNAHFFVFGDAAFDVAGHSDVEDMCAARYDVGVVAAVVHGIEVTVWGMGCPDAEGNGHEANGSASICKPQVLRLRASRSAQDDININWLRQTPLRMTSKTKQKLSDCWAFLWLAPTQAKEA